MAVPEELQQQLSSPDEGVRYRAMRELAQTGSPEEARPWLQAASDDPSRLVRFLARELLAEAGDSRVAQPGRSERPPPSPRAASTSERDVYWLLFSFDGRIRRSSFWIASLSMAMVFGLINMVVGAVLGASDIAFVLALLLAVPQIWASLALQVKRWHDRDRSGWWILIGLVPVIGGLWALVETGFLRGTVGPNRYGDEPS